MAGLGKLESFGGFAANSWLSYTDALPAIGRFSVPFKVAAEKSCINYRGGFVAT
jgi:hypothetical protein